VKVEIEITQAFKRRLMQNRDWYMSASLLNNTAGEILARMVIAAIEKGRANEKGKDR
jgi:hypothetical protein